MLIDEIRNLVGCKIANIETLTEVKLPKKSGLQCVTKFAEGEVQLNYSYSNAVNNRLEKQGDDRSFTSKPLPWGNWFIPNKVIEHKGNYYLRYYLMKGKELNETYFVNGRPATQSEIDIIKEYDKPSTSATQTAVGLLENQVEPKVVRFENIVSLKCGDYINYRRPQTAVA